MFQRKTIFIVGAGASKEFGLPLGADLAKNISRTLDIRFDWGTEPIGSGDHQLYSRLKNAFPDIASDLQSSAWLIRDGILLSNSIDDFLDRHSQNVPAIVYGKAAIIKTVLSAERSSSLFIDTDRGDGRLRIAQIIDTWLVRLFRMLGTNVKVENVENIFKNVGFVIFNYDRIIEHFLVEALKSAYRLDAPTAQSIVSKTEILHPYGSIGSISSEFGNRIIPFGGYEHNSFDLELTKQIRTDPPPLRVPERM